MRDRHHPSPGAAKATLWSPTIEAAFARDIVSRLLPTDILHHRVADRVWSAFIGVEFDVAAFEAMKGVEVEACEFGDI
ncbi:hypothetical protein ACCS96_12055 [Rhizobium ruizarguesonis]